MNLREIRLEKKLTQSEAANLLGVSRRTYINYEQGELDEFSKKYEMIRKALENANLIDEEHGVLTIEQIKNTCQKIFEQYEVEFAYLFGSYAKGKASEKSDVDILLCSSITGIKFFGLVETIREQLHKKIDLLDINQLNNNMELTREILKYGIKIYG